MRVVCVRARRPPSPSPPPLWATSAPPSVPRPPAPYSQICMASISLAASCLRASTQRQNTRKEEQHASPNHSPACWRAHLRRPRAPPVQLAALQARHPPRCSFALALCSVLCVGDAEFWLKRQKLSVRLRRGAGDQTELVKLATKKACGSVLDDAEGAREQNFVPPKFFCFGERQFYSCVRASVHSGTTFRSCNIGDLWTLELLTSRRIGETRAEGDCVASPRVQPKKGI